jgi:cysteine-rich repeat protein
VVDFRNLAAGTEIELTNSAPSHFPGTPGVGVIPQVMKFRVLAEQGYLGPIPGALRPVPPLHESDAVGPPRDFNLSFVQDAEHCGNMWVIESIQDGTSVGMHWDDIVDFPKLGTTEVWRFFNGSPFMHAMHIHLVQAQLLDRRPAQMVDGRIEYTGPPVLPQPEEAGWKDTFQVPPGPPGGGMVTRVIMRFEDYADLYPLHCHLLEHEDNEMMRQFRVVECGNGVVEHGEQCDDGNTANGDCCSSTCQFEPAGSTCSDGNACTTSDTCNSAGQCLGGAPPNCDDASVCTADSCDATAGCVHAPLSGGVCNDGNLCTTGDTCRNGACVGTSHANDPEPGSSEDWKKLACGGPNKGDALTPADIDCVNDVPNFSDVATLDDVCSILKGTPGKVKGGKNDAECDQAEKELMAFAINRCRARVCDESAISNTGSTCGGTSNTTVGQNWTEAAGLILDLNARTVAMCNQSRCLSQEINDGHAFKSGAAGGPNSTINTPRKREAP